ncbi:hypothetical protein [Shewanella maritima]|uniref:hypothetical protein n=1 Tax=Shewanella maritima TaxID=2520507 RepID=UPI003735E32F
MRQLLQRILDEQYVIESNINLAKSLLNYAKYYRRVGNAPKYQETMRLAREARLRAAELLGGE